MSPKAEQDAAKKPQCKPVGLTKKGAPRKRAKGAGRKSAGRVRIVAYVLPATADAIDAVELEQGVRPGPALDILLGITPPVSPES